MLELLENFSDHNTIRMRTVIKKSAAAWVVTLSNLNRLSKFFHRLKKELYAEQKSYAFSHHTFNLLPHYLVKLENFNLSNICEENNKNCIVFRTNSTAVINLAIEFFILAEQLFEMSTFGWNQL